MPMTVKGSMQISSRFQRQFDEDLNDLSIIKDSTYFDTNLNDESFNLEIFKNMNNPSK